ncbi:MAG: insulinase family protein [Gemmatimonadetes bacterium]|nr:insulinase family protein [Gemmatimonadota bacterium]
MNIFVTSLGTSLAFAVAVPALPGQETESPPPPIADSAAALQDSTPTVLGQGVNPFGGFETHFLDNGLKIWYRHVPGAPNVSVSVGVPYGWDRDLEGKEELAHFTEHMLFSDHDGRTESEIKEAIEGRGGRRNGFTTPDHTWYYVTIAKEHGLFAIEWLSRIVSPHAMDPEVVDRNRQPVALEINARPREFFELLGAFLNPEWLRVPGYWEREFGMVTRSARVYDRYANLHAVTAEDLRQFYDTYYVPGAMTLTVIGDLELERVLTLADSTFGTLARRPLPQSEVTLEDPGRYRATFSWPFASNIRYTRRFKVFEPSAQDELAMIFVRELLGRRLNQRLRYGERKAVYTLQVAIQKRGPASFLQISGQINEDEYDFAVGVIEEELRALREGSLPPEDFEADRDALLERLKTSNQTSESINFWAYRRFYDPFVHEDFPDVIGFFEAVGQEELASFASRAFVHERETLSVARPQPYSQGLVLASLLLLVWISFRLVAFGLTTPIDMTSIRYVARFRLSLPFRVALVAILGGLALVIGRTLLIGFEWIALRYVVTTESYWVQTSSFAAMLVTGIAVLVTYMAMIPRKILVFPDHLRIKGLAYRSRVLEPEDIEDIGPARFGSVWLSKQLPRTTPLTLGLVRPGILLRPVKGRAYFFRVRKSPELLQVLEEWKLGLLEGAPLAGTGEGAEPSDEELKDLGLDDPDLSEFGIEG